MISHVRLIDDGKGYATLKDDDGKPKNETLYKNIINKNFEFFPDRINILFGPNQCGKTTIIRSIANNIGIVDGWPKIYKSIGKDETYLDKIKKDSFSFMYLNTAVLNWDGAPVYYENFRDTALNRNFGSIGNLEGSLFNGAEELGFYMNKQRVSEGQMSMWFLNKLIDKFYKKEKPRWEDILKGADKKQLDYFLEAQGSKDGLLTILLDESDKGFDIDMQWKFISRVLPGMMKELNVQLIVASHSPFIVSDPIFTDPLYNIISIDPEYTQKVRELVKIIYGNTKEDKKSTETEER